MGKMDGISVLPDLVRDWNQQLLLLPSRTTGDEHSRAREAREHQHT